MATSHTNVALAAGPFKVAKAGAEFSGAKATRVPVLVKDVYYGGRGRIYGTVKEKGSLDNTPLRRRVWLINEAARTIVRETWSDAKTGEYEFLAVDTKATYSVIAYDHERNFQAVVADGIMPEIMP